MSAISDTCSRPSTPLRSRAGRVRQAGEPLAGKRGYWLIAPAPQWRQKKVKALVEALRGA